MMTTTMTTRAAAVDADATVGPDADATVETDARFLYQ